MNFPVDFFSVHPHDNPRTPDQISQLLISPGFGKHFTDHMVVINYSKNDGWHDGRVVPFAPITLMPTAGVLHYGQEIFEGLKAYRQPDGSIATFRPQANARRFQSSAERLAMPQLPEELFLRSIEELLAIDHRYVPHSDNASLYLRPLLFASEPVIGIRPANEYMYILFGSPVEPYFNINDTTPVWVSYDYVRAAPGGTGAAKCGGNYAGSLVAQQQALDHGCGQVVWLDAVERRYIEEMGGMNLFFVYDDQIITPELSGALLPGITRDSLITLARDLGYSVVEQKITIDDVEKDARSGKLREVFACGTAAVITPVGLFRSDKGEFTIADGKPGKITTVLRDHLTGIQKGLREDHHNWRYQLVDAQTATA